MERFTLRDHGYGATACALCLLAFQLLGLYLIMLLGDRHIGVNNLPKVTVQRDPAETRTRDQLITDSMLYAK